MTNTIVIDELDKKKRSYYAEHQCLLRKFKKKCQKKIKKIRFFDNTVGLFKTLQDQYVQIGTKGMPDCCGWYPSYHGIILIHFEIKAGKSGLNKEQKRMRKIIESMGGIVIIVRHDIDLAIDEALFYLEKKKLL